eukprot:1159699-Pelagomonas_calceolata.AAC.11
MQTQQCGKVALKNGALTCQVMLDISYGIQQKACARMSDDDKELSGAQADCKKGGHPLYNSWQEHTRTYTH